MADLVARARGYGTVDAAADTLLVALVYADLGEWLGMDYESATLADRYHAVQRLLRGR